MRIAISCEWEREGNKVLVDGTTVSLNKFDPSVDYVVDLGCVFSKLALQYPPEKRVFAACEPTTYLGLDPDMVTKMGTFYKGLILAWHASLSRLPQTRKFRMGSSWVSWSTKPEDKIFGIGAIFSGKNNAVFPGYAVRRKILAAENSISIPSMVFSPSNTWKGIPFDYPLPSKKPSLDFMFHFAIENCSEEGYFTEKIMDCFITYSVPIYFGDPKIADEFASEGIILLDQKDIARQVNSFTPDLYWKKIEAVVENRKRAEKYWHFEDNVVEHIKMEHRRKETR